MMIILIIIIIIIIIIMIMIIILIIIIIIVNDLKSFGLAREKNSYSCRSFLAVEN